LSKVTMASSPQRYVFSCSSQGMCST
jgi:hypothetical protein